MKVDSAQGERRQITVLFADMAGYAAVSERLGEEGVYELIQAIYTILADAVRELGGTVQDFTGDGIMALFGAPTGSYSPHNAINFGQNAWQLSPLPRRHLARNATVGDQQPTDLRLEQSQQQSLAGLRRRRHPGRRSDGNKYVRLLRGFRQLATRRFRLRASAIRRCEDRRVASPRIRRSPGRRYHPDQLTTDPNHGRHRLPNRRPQSPGAFASSARRAARHAVGREARH